MKVGDRVRISDTAGAGAYRKYAGQAGTIVAMRRSTPTGLTWDEVMTYPKDSAEIRLDSGSTPFALFHASVLDRI